MCTRTAIRDISSSYLNNDYRQYYHSNNNRNFYIYQNNPIQLSNVLKEKNIPITLTWNVNAWIPIKNGSFFSRCFRKDDENNFKYLLTNVKGIVKPGQLCAIMGASGAGKTTLLNILNFRNKGKIQTEANVKINGIQADWDMITKYSGFVQQDDLFNGVLTVREHLTFISMLKLGSSYSRDERHELNLVKSEETIIGMGDKLKGLSGGEKRRLAYASEIVNHPPLLFCDEPTSGLDSSMAYSLVASMRQLADSGKTIICTIHQPTSQTFEMFDTIILLAEGRIAFIGPTHVAPHFFSRTGYRIPKLYNPADHYIQPLAISPHNREYDIQRVNEIVEFFEQSEFFAEITYDIQLTESQPVNLDDYDEIPEYNTGYYSQFGWLLWRQLKLDIRNPYASKITVIQVIIIAVFLGLVFLRLENNEFGVQNKSGALFIIIFQASFGFLLSVVNTFPSDLTLVYRESKNRLYSITPYYLVKQIAELPKFIIIPGFMITVVYYMAGLNDNFGVFVQIFFTIILCTQVAVSWGLFLSAASPNSEAAIALVAPAVMPLLILCGF
ncbi:unnamed protein product [Brachionus calyciflorus]|uniref:ABC transporter domain-containing protein n=1 Tax=Brachionus calyciflorus TaxID=104777 RepID=A0A814AML9_9BILA|nr:unnamed protein product [Brachionus calyciflorus]